MKIIAIAVPSLVLIISMNTLVVVYAAEEYSLISKWRSQGNSNIELAALFCVAAESSGNVLVADLAKKNRIQVFASVIPIHIDTTRHSATITLVMDDNNVFIEHNRSKTLKSSMFQFKGTEEDIQTPSFKCPSDLDNRIVIEYKLPDNVLFSDFIKSIESLGFSYDRKKDPIPVPDKTQPSVQNELIRGHIQDISKFEDIKYNIEKTVTGVKKVSRDTPICPFANYQQ